MMFCKSCRENNTTSGHVCEQCKYLTRARKDTKEYLIVVANKYNLSDEEMIDILHNIVGEYEAGDEE